MLQDALATRGFTDEVRALLARVRGYGLDPPDLKRLAVSARRPDWAGAARFLAAPHGGDMARSAADVGLGRFQVAVQVADAMAAGVGRLPDFPAMAAGFIGDDEPVVDGEKADEGQAGVAQLDDAQRLGGGSAEVWTISVPSGGMTHACAERNQPKR